MKRYTFKIGDYSYYIVSEAVISENELSKIKEILSNFPHASKSHASVKKFLEFSASDIAAPLLAIAANAFDSYGNTMLGVACENGSVEAVQKLINMGAKLDTPDHSQNKLALHWAINNKKSSHNPESEEAAGVVKCLLQNGARTDITCYGKTTPLNYAKSRGFKAAATLIEATLESVKNSLIAAASTCDAKAINQTMREIKTKSVNFDINTIRNSRGETLLMLASAGNRKMPHGQSHSAVKLLLESGADPLATSNDGRTALMEAANFGRASVVTLLIDNVPLNKRIQYIEQCDNTKGSAKEMSAYEYAGQLGHYIMTWSNGF